MPPSKPCQKGILKIMKSYNISTRIKFGSTKTFGNEI